MSIPSTGLSEHERLVTSPRRAKLMLDCGNTRLYELLNSNELESYLDGRSRKIVVASIHALIARRLAGAASAAPAELQPHRRVRPCNQAGPEVTNNQVQTERQLIAPEGRPQSCPRGRSRKQGTADPAVTDNQSQNTAAGKAVAR